MTPLLLHVSALITAAFIAGLWQGLVITMMGVALCGFMPRASAAFRHAILIVLFAGALLLPFTYLHKSDVPSGGHGLTLAPWIGVAIAAVWLLAAAFRSVHLYLAWRHLSAVRLSAVAVQVQDATGFKAGSRHALLYSSPDVQSPTILGFHSPRLLLPDWMIPGLSESELQQITLHECEHLRRGDDWMNLLLQVGLMLSPLNPALFWLNRTISVQRELAVDAAVVAHTAKPLAYAACLTRLAEQRLEHGRLRLALTAWERKSELVQRVQILLDRSSCGTRVQSAWASAAAVVIMVMAIAAMSRVPQLVQVAEESAHASTQSSAFAQSVTLMQSSHGADALSTPHLERTSFRMASTQPDQSRVMWKKTSASLTDSSHARTFVIQRPARAPKMTRSRYVWSREVLTAHNFQPSATEPVLLTPSLIHSYYAAVPASYVALPTSNGWLLIEL